MKWPRKTMDWIFFVLLVSLTGAAFLVALGSGPWLIKGVKTINGVAYCQTIEETTGPRGNVIRREKWEKCREPQQD